MIDNWNTPTWKAKSKRNKRIRSRATGGKHTLGSQSYATAKKSGKSFKKKTMSILPSLLTLYFFIYRLRYWAVNRQLVSCGNKHIVGKEAGLWIKIQVKKIWYGLMIGQRRLGLSTRNILWRSTRMNLPNLIKTYGNKMRGGMKKGKVYGLGIVTDPYVHGKHDPEVCLMFIIEAIIPLQSEVG
ncbi:hypothetical protein Hanom_Chr00s168670g01827901 [Helianthus anomalus]